MSAIMRRPRTPREVAIMARVMRHAADTGARVRLEAWTSDGGRIDSSDVVIERAGSIAGWARRADGQGERRFEYADVSRVVHEGMATLTRGQLAALTELTLSGALAPAGEAVNASTATTYRRATLDALVNASVARQVQDGAYLPTLTRWADGYGIWHVAVPDHIVNAAAVARAVIAGEVWARSRPSRDTGWRPRVVVDTSVVRPGFILYGEA